MLAPPSNCSPNVFQHVITFKLISSFLHEQIPVVDLEGTHKLPTIVDGLFKEPAVLAFVWFDVVRIVLAANVRHVNSYNDIGLLLFQSDEC